MENTPGSSAAVSAANLQSMDTMNQPFPQFPGGFPIGNPYAMASQGYSHPGVAGNDPMHGLPFLSADADSARNSTQQQPDKHQRDCTGCANHDECAMFKPLVMSEASATAGTESATSSTSGLVITEQGDSPADNSQAESVKKEQNMTEHGGAPIPERIREFPSTSSSKHVARAIKRYSDTPIFKVSKKTGRLLNSSFVEDCPESPDLEDQVDGSVESEDIREIRYKSSAISSIHSGLSLLIASEQSNPDSSDLEYEGDFTLGDNAKLMKLDEFLHKSPNNKRHEFNNAVATELFPLKQKLFPSKRGFLNYLAEQQKWRWEFYQAYVDVATRTNNTLYKPSSGFAQNCARFTNMPENPRGEDVRRCEATSKVLEEIASRIADLRVELLKRKGSTIYNDSGEARFQPCPSELKFLEQIFDETEKLYQGVLTMMSNVSKTWEKLQNLFSEEQVEKANRQRVLRRKRENLRKKKKRALISLEKAAFKLLGKISPVGMGHSKRQRSVEEIHLMELNKLSTQRDAELLQFLVEKSCFVGQAEQVIIGKIRMLEVICGCTIAPSAVSNTPPMVTPPSSSSSSSSKSKKKKKSKKGSKRAAIGEPGVSNVVGPAVVISPHAAGAGRQMPGPGVWASEIPRATEGWVVPSGTIPTHSWASDPRSSGVPESMPVVSQPWMGEQKLQSVGMGGHGVNEGMGGTPGHWVVKKEGATSQKTQKSSPNTLRHQREEAGFSIGAGRGTGDASSGLWAGKNGSLPSHGHGRPRQTVETGPVGSGTWSSGTDTPLVSRPLPTGPTVVDSSISSTIVRTTGSNVGLTPFVPGVSPIFSRPPMVGTGPYGPMVTDAPLRAAMPSILAPGASGHMFLDNVGGTTRTVPSFPGTMPVVPLLGQTSPLPVVTGDRPTATWTLPTAASGIPAGVIPAMSWAQPGSISRPPTSTPSLVPGVSR